MNVEFDHKSLKEAIAEYILYYQMIENKDLDLNLICDELGLIDKHKIQNKLESLQKIRKI